MNLLGPELVRDLVTLIQEAEADDAVQVLVFASAGADPDYFISHVDLNRIAKYRAEAAKLTGEASIALLFRHLSASRLVTIAQIAGRVRAAGSEFVLACDMRFAARESAIFSQFEPAFGLIPGGAPLSTSRVHGPRPRTGGHVVRAGPRRRAGRAVRLDQPDVARRGTRRLRQVTRPPDRAIPGHRPATQRPSAAQCLWTRLRGRATPAS